MTFTVLIIMVRNTSSHKKMDGITANFATWGPDGCIYVIDVKRGHIIAWNPSNASRRTVSEQNWSDAKGMVEIGGTLYVITSDIWSVSPMNGSASQVTEDGDWDCCVAACSHNGAIWVVSKKGPIYSIKTSGKWTEIGDDDWGKSKAIVDLNGKVHVIHDYIWAYHQKDESFEEASDEGEWDTTFLATVHSGHIICICKVSGHIKGKLFEWKGKAKELGSDEWIGATAMIGK